MYEYIALLIFSSSVSEFSSTAGTAFCASVSSFPNVNSPIVFLLITSILSVFLYNTIHVSFVPSSSASSSISSPSSRSSRNIVTVAVALFSPHIAVIVAVPLLTAVIIALFPLPDTVAVSSLELVQVSSPSIPSNVAVISAVSPILFIPIFDGFSVIPMYFSIVPFIFTTYFL